jgi:shikimate dehydrogenase
VSHSLSPAIFTAAFSAAGIQAVYDLFPIPPDHLSNGIGELLRKGIKGLNVTVPHKTAVIPQMTRLDESARLTGAVNTIEVTDDGMVGYNTDMGGFEDSFGPLNVPDVTRARVLVLGAGGAARAVVVSLARSGASKIIIANRFPEETVDLLSAVAPRFPGVGFEAVELDREELSREAVGAVLCVQATSLGLREEDPLPLDPTLLPEECFVYDLVYGAMDTPFVRFAAALGYRAVDGKEMLLRQAARAFSIWFRKDPPIPAMKAAVDHAIGAKN